MRLAWAEIEPSVFVQGWHVDALAEHLEAVTRGQIRRLLINMPPGCMKSLSVSVLWPAWVWATLDPSHRWIFASYSAALSRRDAVRMRNLVDSPWFHARFPGIEIPRQNTRSATDFANSRGGWRFSTSTEGSVTGRHADTQVVDDPIKPADTLNAGGVEGAALDKVIEWWRSTMASRQADPKTGRRVIVMQRLHERDLAGAMLAEGGYEHLILPMRFDPARKFSTSITLRNGARVPFQADPRIESGALLWPERFPEDAVSDLEREFGASVAAAQLQQRPSPAGGDLFRAAWFEHRWKILPARMTLIQSWDLRFKDSASSGDYVVGQVWGARGGEYYLIDQVRGRWGFVETLARIRELSARHPLARLKLIENAANGPAVADTLKREIPGIVLVTPEGGKYARANATAPLWEAGNVKIPEAAPWLADFIGEHLTFPKATHDDQVDAASQGLGRLYVRGATRYREGLEVLARATK